MHPVLQSLQQVVADIIIALQQIDGLAICKWRTNVDSEFADLYTKAEKFCGAFEVPLIPLRVLKRSLYRPDVGE